MIFCKDGYYEKKRWHFWWEGFQSWALFLHARGNVTPGEKQFLARFHRHEID